MMMSDDLLGVQVFKEFDHSVPDQNGCSGYAILQAPNTNRLDEPVATRAV